MKKILKFLVNIATVLLMAGSLLFGFGFLFVMFLLRTAVIVGALNEIFHLVRFDYLSREPVTIIFYALINSWEKFAILIIFFESWRRRRIFEEVRETNTNVKRFMCVIGDYFQIGFSTKAIDALRENGLLRTFRQNGAREIKELFRGKSTIDDDGLTAYPTRGYGGKKGDITFERDMENILSSKSK